MPDPSVCWVRRGRKETATWTVELWTGITSQPQVTVLQQRQQEQKGQRRITKDKKEEEEEGKAPLLSGSLLQTWGRDQELPRPALLEEGHLAVAVSKTTSTLASCLSRSVGQFREENTVDDDETMLGETM